MTNHPLSTDEALRFTRGRRCSGPAAADEGRLDEAKAALEHSLSSSELFGAPLLVVANKQVQRQARLPHVPLRKPTLQSAGRSLVAEAVPGRY